MSLINVLNLTFAYPNSYDNVFTDVSFSINTDWRLGFCGRNGRGKTTFLKLLAGELEYSGKITANVKFDYFPPSVENGEDNALDIIYSLAPDAELWRIKRELSLLNTDEGVLYRPFNSCSNGERTKILLAGLFLRENNFLLIDEPTNHLDIEARETVAKYLKAKPGFILVSHDRAFLDACVDHILSINRSGLEVMSGNFSTWQEQKDIKDAFEISKNEKLAGEITRLKKAAEVNANWSDKLEKTKNGTRIAGLRPDRGHIGHQAAKLMKRSKVIEKRQNNAIDEKSKLLKNIERDDELKISPIRENGKRLITLSDVSVFYGERTVFYGFDLTLNGGDRLALTGGNGSGKSSVLKLICSPCDIPHTGGGIHKPNRLVISYVPQDASFLTGRLDEYARLNNIDETLFKSILAKLDFSKTQLSKDMSGFSAGQKKKVLIAKSLSERAHIYIWDEPLNYIDIISRIQIENLIKEYEPTMIFVEHDKAFIDTVATDIINLKEIN